MKKIIILVILTLFIISCESSKVTFPITPIFPIFPIIPAPEAWNGIDKLEPEVNDDGDYKVVLTSHFAWFEGQDIAKDIIFMNNLDMNNHQFDGIKSFSGVMDGNGKIIEDLKIETTSDAGLILTMTEGTIKNLTIENGEVKGTGNVGAFVAKTEGTLIFNGVTNKAVVIGKNTGGIVGLSEGETMSIENAENFGDITASGIYSTAGGIIGLNENKNITIISVKNSGVVTGNSAGGIIGLNDKIETTTIKKVMNFNSIKASGQYSASGGIIGYNDGGIVLIEYAGNIGDINSDGNGGSAGGIIGSTFIHPSITSKIKIKVSYNYGNITSSIKGGIVGDLGKTILTITDSFYLTGSADNAVGEPASDEGATKIDATAFRTKSKFTGWNFSAIWEMGAGYPILK